VLQVIVGAVLVNTSCWLINCFKLGGTNKVKHSQCYAAAYAGEGMQQTSLKGSNYLDLGLVFALDWLRIAPLYETAVFFGAKLARTARL
jgi:hypothetical protein